MKKPLFFAALIAAAFISTQVWAVPVSHRLESQKVTTPAASPKTDTELTDPSSSAAQTTQTNKEVKTTKSWEFPVPDPLMPGPVKTIVIDPGHGGTNEGSIGSAKIYEKHLTLQIALMLADQMREKMPGVEVILTRQHDASISLADRIDMANKINADLFISLHFNSSGNPQAIGFESFWGGDFWQADMQKQGIEITDQMRESRAKIGSLSYRMGSCFNRAMRHRSDVPDRGVKPGNYTVLTRAEVPAVVLELGFLSHEEEGILATTPAHRAKYVEAIVEAVSHYADTSYVLP